MRPFVKLNSVYNFIAVILILFSFGSCVQKDKSASQNAEKKVIDTITDELSRLNAKVKQNPKEVAPYLERAVYFARAMQPNEALGDVNLALSLDEKNPEVYASLSEVYMYDGKMQRALDALKKATELAPDEARYNVMIARLYLTMSDYKQTFNSLRDALKKDPTNAEAFFISGLAHEEMGDTAKAIENYQLAVARKQGHYDALKQLGILYSIKKDKLAIDYLRNAASLRADNPEALYVLGMFYQENGDPDKALSVYEEILIMKPDYLLAHFNKGYIFLVFKEDYLQAIESFSKAIELDDKNVDALYNRALAYELMGDKKNARTGYERILRMKVNDDKAIKGLNRLDALGK
jgi:tetratricopeptide (TPR) repeat protein